MYNFVDTVSKQSSTELPSEALCINGVYIENEIDGYRTLSVEGRELLESEVGNIQIGNQDGRRYKQKRDEVRTIQINYQMLSNSPEDFREKFNKLCALINNEESKLIFLDEPDKYYIGTKESIGDVDSGRLNVKGSFTFTCSDPYKYKITEKTANNEGGKVITLQNDGTKPVPINVKATMKSDNGYLGLTLDDRFYQIGHQEEVDGKKYEVNVTLFDDHMWKDRGWLLNQGVTPPVTPERLQNGVISYTKEAANEGYIQCTNYKTGNSWHGAAMTKIVPADENGKYPVNWRSCWRFDFNTDGATDKGSQIGHNSVTFSDGDDNIIVSVVFEDNNVNSERSDMAIYIGQKRVWDTKNTTKFYVTAREGGPCVVVEKIGTKVSVRFSYAGISKTFQVEDKNAELRKVTWYGATYKGYAAIRNNLLRALQVVKYNVERYEDIPNYFASGDGVYLDGMFNKLYINDVINMDTVDIGSQPLLLPPGEHTLGIVTSTFSEMPEVEVTYRERWI